MGNNTYSTRDVFQAAALTVYLSRKPVIEFENSGITYLFQSDLVLSNAIDLYHNGMKLPIKTYAFWLLHFRGLEDSCLKEFH